jgi:NitT/TauT family transport system permease protein
VLWAGFETTAKVIILFLFAFFPMAINTYQGVKNVDPRLIEVGRAFRCSEAQLWTNIVLPGALIGYLIVRTASTYQVDKMFVPIMTLGILGVTLTALLRVLEIKVAPWTAASQAD